MTPAAAAADLAWTSPGPYGRALRAGRGPLFLRRADGWLLPLDVERWCAGPDAADRTVLERCTGPVLDIGCGPGRLVAALAADGHPALGIDLSTEAVRHAGARGASALRRSVFDPLPGAGRWGTALLMDGNIGIGGDPHALLTRIAQLLRPTALLLIEVAAEDVDERVHVHVDDGRGTAASAPSFPWARVGSAALRRRAAGAGWRVSEEWQAAGRSFVAARRSTAEGA
ncbi:class I SAM-dependent methyltransferase [Streptomyces boninensis]|uniref:class I SAM-dependent methyltransferase n=1 Tax=Streptomyces boninensis TaxID=2039455 RepID=UPI003B227DFD